MYRNGVPGALFNPLRLVVGLAVVLVLLLPLYFFVIRQPHDPNVQRVQMLPTSSDAELEVGLDEGKLAPDFEFSTPEGHRVRLSDFQGRPLVINFWATWCTGCLSEMPDLKALQEERGTETISVLAINAGETRARAEEFIDFLEAPFVYGMDPGLVLSDAYGVHGLPLSVFLDSEGIVRGVYRGHAQPAVLEAYVSAAIEARPPGEVPVVLRLISTIPRERVVVLTSEGPGQLSFTSRSLRCDAIYCARDAIHAGLQGMKGMKGAVFTTDAGGEPALHIDFNAAELRDDAVIDAVVGLLEALEDPVYDRPLEVRFESRRE